VPGQRRLQAPFNGSADLGPVDLDEPDLGAGGEEPLGGHRVHQAPQLAGGVDGIG
jgi:hypothetical protein